MTKMAEGSNRETVHDTAAQAAAHRCQSAIDSMDTASGIGCCEIIPFTLASQVARELEQPYRKGARLSCGSQQPAVASVSAENFRNPIEPRVHLANQIHEVTAMSGWLSDGDAVQRVKRIDE